MNLPARLVTAVRPHASAGLLAGAAVVAAVFAVTPFVLPDVAARTGTALGTTGVLSSVQVAGFAGASFVGGRLLRPTARAHHLGLVLVVVGNLVAAASADLGWLAASRLVAGIGMGIVTWVAWADAATHPRALGDVAAVGPLTAVVASPVAAWLVAQGGYRLAYLALAVVAGVALLVPVQVADLPRVGRRVSDSRSNRWLLLGLLLLTMGGSAVFIFTGAAGQAVAGLGPVAVSWAFSANALSGALGTRFSAPTGQAWAWILVAAVCAVVVGTVASPVAFFVAMVLWGFAFWMAVPVVFRLLAERSLAPNERIGDAQALMAVGRVFGPLVAAWALGDGAFRRLSMTGASIMVLAALVVGIVELARRRGWTRAVRPVAS